MENPRYAIYYTPAADHELTVTAARWLGRDAFSGDNIERTVAADFEFDLDSVTGSPRHYGFHATLKAPFELAEGKTEQDLLVALDTFCAASASFEVSLSPDLIGNFLAMRLVEPSDAMTDLHSRCVKEFDEFRAPLSDYDLARRRKAPLTDVQDKRLVAWGYPYIFDEFRFHMTLTGYIKDDGLRGQLIQLLRTQVGQFNVLVDGVAVFYQPSREADFTVLQRGTFSS